MRHKTALGSVLFFFAAPGSVAGLVPWLITGWRVEPSFFPLAPVIGVLVIACGAASIVESFRRFAQIGQGTPAPVAPPEKLVVSGQYRFVRNPMYVALLALILGQGLLFGSILLMLYGGLVFMIVDAFVRFYEEPTLRAKFGHEYYLYCAGVRRWIPSRRPWAGPEGDLPMSEAQKQMWK